MRVIEQMVWEVKQLKVGMTVWARWTNNGNSYHVAATVTKLNVASLQVTLLKDVRAWVYDKNADNKFSEGDVIYRKGLRISLPRVASTKGRVNPRWSLNNGCFAEWLFDARGEMQRMVRCEKCTADVVVEDKKYERGGHAECTNRFCGKAFEVPPRAKPGHHMVRCPGEAHSNGYIDNCGMCAPRWGWLELPEKYGCLDEYRDACAFARNPGMVHHEDYVRDYLREDKHRCGSDDTSLNVTKFAKLVTCPHCKGKLEAQAKQKESA